MNFEVNLKNLFEGPIDLLLYLIKKNEIDIYNIPIALITRQYLDYLDIIKSLNLDLAGEYLVMASTLVHIKSRLLLPVPEDPSDEEEEGDPRSELVRQLLRGTVQSQSPGRNVLDQVLQLPAHGAFHRCLRRILRFAPLQKPPVKQPMPCHPCQVRNRG